MATETISLEPDYGAVFARFIDCAKYEQKRFLKDASENVRVGIHVLPKVSNDALHRVRSYLSCFNTALSSATTQAEIDELREHLYEFSGELAKLDDNRQERADDDSSRS
jgi:hypothetical protein